MNVLLLLFLVKLGCQGCSKNFCKVSFLGDIFMGKIDKSKLDLLCLVASSVKS